MLVIIGVRFIISIHHMLEQELNAIPHVDEVAESEPVSENEASQTAAETYEEAAERTSNRGDYTQEMMKAALRVITTTDGSVEKGKQAWEKAA